MKQSAQGFTLIELLVVIAVIAILVTAVVLIINPFEIIHKGNDINRMRDLSNLRQAISAAIIETTTGSALLCQNQTTPCTGLSTTGTQKVDGTGWVFVDISETVTLPLLPIDPINSTIYHYTYCSDGIDWEINAVLESNQQKGEMKTDGGNEDDKYEVGSKLDLIAPSGGICTY